MNISSALQTGIIGLNRTQDNVAKAAGDLQGSGKPEQPQEATGRQTQTLAAVQGTTVQPTESAATQVVSEATATLGGNIDIHV